jgi:cytoskeletal protein CcmA (bactofilin family)
MYFKSLFLVVIFTVALVTLPLSVSADTVIRTGETVSIDSDQRIEGDFYTAASILNLSGEVSEDMSAVGGKVTLNGNVGKDALFVGGSVDVHGSVGDDLRVVGGDVVLAEPVTGDVFVMARSVTVLDTASIGGDLIIYAADAEVSGSVGGDVVGRIDTVRLDAPIKGTVDITTTQFTVGDRADIAGTVRYVSATEITRSPNAKIGGEITRNDPIRKEASLPVVKTLLIPVLMVLFTALVWYLVARRLLTAIVDRALVRTIRPAATGFIAFFAAPVIIVILTVSVLGTLVGITALAAYIFAILLAVVSSAAVLGQLIVKLYKKDNIPLSPLTLCIGVLAMTVLALIPVIGVMTLVILFVATLGALVDLVLHPSQA